MSELKGVVIGAGYFSRFHLDAWNRIHGVRIAGVCDVRHEVAEDAAARFNISSAYSDFVRMLDAERPDFVDIITRPDSHLDIVRACAERRVPMICQKPLAPTFAEACELLIAADSGGAPLMVHENFRFQPWHREIKRLLNAKTIGQCVHSISIRTRLGDGWAADAYLNRQPYFREMPRLLIFETGVHFIDTLRFLAGEIEGVYATIRKQNPAIAGEDCATVMFEFESGAQGIWDGNRFNEPNCPNPRYTFCDALLEGDGGSIRLYSDGRLTIQPLGEAEREHEYEHDDHGFAGDCVLTTQSHFVECLTTGRPFETSGADYLKTLAVVEAVYESAALRQPVRSIGARNTA